MTLFSSMETIFSYFQKNFRLSFKRLMVGVRLCSGKSSLNILNMAVGLMSSFVGSLSTKSIPIS